MLTPEEFFLVGQRNNGASMKEIAETQQLPLETIKKRVQRAAEHFRSALIAGGFPDPKPDKTNSEGNHAAVTCKYLK